MQGYYAQREAKAPCRTGLALVPRNVQVAAMGLDLLSAMGWEEGLQGVELAEDYGAHSTKRFRLNLFMSFWLHEVC